LSHGDSRWWATKGIGKYLRAGGKQFAVDEDKIKEEARYDRQVGTDNEHGSPGA